MSTTSPVDDVMGRAETRRSTKTLRASMMAVSGEAYNTGEGGEGGVWTVRRGGEGKRRVLIGLTVAMLVRVPIPNSPMDLER